MSITNPKLKDLPKLESRVSEIKNSLKGISYSDASLLLYEIDKELQSELIV